MKFRNVISGPIFCADAPDVVIETADAAGIDVRLSISGFVWQFALSPVAEQSGYVATIKTRDILEALIEPSSIGSGGVSGVPVVEISAGADTESSISMSFQALYGSAAGKTPADMARHWLTWRDQISTTYFGCRERLTFFAGLDLLGWKSGSYTVAVKIYTPSGIVQATLASGTIPSQVSYISVDASPASVLAVGEISSLLAYDLSFSLSGTAADDTAATVKSYPLRLVLGAADPRAKEFIYINSLGVEDRVTACGIRKDGLEGGSSKFVNGGVEREHGNEAQEQFEVYSGHLATARSVEQWMEFLKSSERHLYNAGLKGIVIDEYDTEAPEGELSSVSFTYRLSERIRGFHHDDSESIGDYDPKQKYGALIVGDIPDATTPAAADLFFLKTRLDEFPLVSLSEDYLLLVQSPVSYHWGAASLDSIKKWIQKTIDHNGISLAAVWASLSKTVPDTYANELISEDHIPTLPQSKVTGLPDALSSLRLGYTGISALIPQAATADNQLADKEFVNSSIATATATFKGTFESLEALKAAEADKNDYAFWAHKDEAGNTCYDKYTYDGSAWKFGYRLNNSSFTAAQWGAINSGITGALVTKLSGIATGAQVNVIETVKLGGTALAVSDKAVDITGTGIKSALGISDWALAASKPSYTTAEVAEKANLYFTDARARSALSGHTGDTTIHITAAERTAWNAKWDWNEAAVKAVKVNAAGSADKLANSHKLWGNAFNGEADVNGDITLGSGKRIYFGSTSYYIELVNGSLHTNVGLYSDKFISARGSDPDAGGGSGASLPVVWASLQGNTDDYKDKTIHQAHIPTLPVSRIDGLAAALAGKQAVISDLDTIRTNAATAYGWGDHSEAGYITGITKAMVESVLTGNITSHTHTFNSLTSKPTTLEGYGIADWVMKHTGSSPDTFKTAGNYKVETNGTSGNGYNFTYGQVLVLRATTDSNTIAQIAASYDNNNLYFRSGTVSNFTDANHPWRKLYHSGNFIDGTNYISPKTTLAGYGITDASRIFRYTIPASGNKGVRITFTANEPVKITVSGSNQHAQLVLVGTGYGEGGFIRNNFTELVHSDSGYSWCMPDEACSVEVFSTRTLSDYVTVESPSPVTFTAISALSTSAVNRCLLTAANYSSFALPLTGGTLSGWLLINASTLSISDLTVDGALQNTTWNRAQNINLLLRSANNAMTISVGGQSNERKGIIQVGHAAATYANVLGDLYLNKFGGKVYIGEKLAYHEGNFIDGTDYISPKTTLEGYGITDWVLKYSADSPDTFKTSGIYRVSTTGTTGNGYWFNYGNVLVLRGTNTSDTIAQLAASSANSNLYYRSGTVSNFTDADHPWRLIYNSGNSNKSDVDWNAANLTAEKRVRIKNANVIAFLSTDAMPKERLLGPMSSYDYDLAWHNGAQWNKVYHSGNSNLPTVPWKCSSLTANGSVEAKANLYGQSLEFLNISSSANHGGFIDFHFKGDTEDYTSRIIEDENGRLTLYAKTLRIGKSNNANLLFLRPSYNYIWAEEAGGTLVLGTADGGQISFANSALLIRGKKVYIGGAESGNNALNVNGVAHATTGIYSDGYVSARGQDTSSDIRLKTDFRPLAGALKYIRGTHFTRFRWRDGGESVGIIAQEEQSREYGFLVRSHGEIGHLTYDYAASTALLGAALQEEDEKVEALKKRVKELENELNKLKQSNYAR